MSEDVRSELSTPSRVRARFARFGATRPAGNPVLEPLMTAVRANHPKADLATLERAYQVAERAHRGQRRKSGDPYITHPVAVATILAEATDPRDAADRLVQAAVRAGGRDNATAVVVDVVGLVKDATYDSRRQQESLESKLGGRL